LAKKGTSSRGVFRNLSRGLHYFFFPGEAQHMLGPENPLKSIDFTGPGGGVSPHPLPWNTPLTSL